MSGGTNQMKPGGGFSGAQKAVLPEGWQPGGGPYPGGAYQPIGSLQAGGPAARPAVMPQGWDDPNSPNYVDYSKGKDTRLGMGGGYYDRGQGGGGFGGWNPGGQIGGGGGFGHPQLGGLIGGGQQPQRRFPGMNIPGLLQYNQIDN